jgi:hypothetical protein
MRTVQTHVICNNIAALYPVFRDDLNRGKQQESSKVMTVAWIILREIVHVGGRAVATRASYHVFWMQTDRLSVHLYFEEFHKKMPMR